MLEFSRKHQEDRIVKEMEDEVLQLSKEEVDLEVGGNYSNYSWTSVYSLK